MLLYSGVQILNAVYQAVAQGNWPLPPLVEDIGLIANGYQNVMDYITIASTGNATDFDNLTVARQLLGTFSNGHGGL